jgi:hypothetical protein
MASRKGQLSGKLHLIEAEIKLLAEDSLRDALVTEAVPRLAGAGDGTPPYRFFP